MSASLPLSRESIIYSSHAKKLRRKRFVALCIQQDCNNIYNVASSKCKGIIIMPNSDTYVDSTFEYSIIINICGRDDKTFHSKRIKNRKFMAFRKIVRENYLYEICRKT